MIDPRLQKQMLEDPGYFRGYLKSKDGSEILVLKAGELLCKLGFKTVLDFESDKSIWERESYLEGRKAKERIVLEPHGRWASPKDQMVDRTNITDYLKYSLFVSLDKPAYDGKNKEVIGAEVNRLREKLSRLFEILGQEDLVMPATGP